MELLISEVKNKKELQEVLKNNKEIAKDYEVAVIVYAFDKDNKIIFQRRGSGCRDERLKLEKFYSNNFNAKMDIKIFFKTFSVVFQKNGAK